MDSPGDLHHYVSFEDPAEQRTWVFDATFLGSNWSCIWGSGCHGVLTSDAQELNHGCCSHGAHFIDDDDLNAVSQSVSALQDHEWQQRADDWFDRDPDGTITTKLVDGVCIFHNRGGYAAGAGCALHNAALKRNERPLDWKPDVCWQLPLRLYEDTDAYGHVTSTLREWKRRDWGEGGAEFHWWCTESADAFVGATPVYEALREEIIEFTGDVVYSLLSDILRSSQGTALAHPAVRHR